MSVRLRCRGVAGLRRVAGAGRAGGLPGRGALLLVLMLAGLAASADSFTISDIRVEGLQRVSAGTVFNTLDVNVGETLDEIGVRSIIRTLFASGYFSDISIARDGTILIITVAERPAIDSIEIEGNKSIKTEALLEGLSSGGLAEGEIFQRVTLERVELELIRQYVGQGRYSAGVDAMVTELPRNRVAIRIEIEEGEVAKVRHLNIVGNSIYPDAELLEFFELQLPGLLSFYTNDDRYSREKLSGDIERLESYYKNSGHVNFRVDSTQVSVNPDKSEVYITINVDEGEKYEVANVELAGELDDVPVAALETLLLVIKGQIFSQAIVTASEERITTALSNAGYTFASATGVPSVDEEAGTVDVRFFIDTDQRTYVRRIGFRGNIVTRDEVLRREMRQFEGGWASTAQIDLSKTRLERLGFFRSVAVETPAVPGTEDQIDVEFTVDEQPSGSISATLGFAQATGLVLGTQYQESNVLGSGNSTSLSLNWSEFRQAVAFNFLNPYFTVDGISRGFNVSVRETNFDQRNIVSFQTNSYGAGVSFGYPINEVERISFGAKAEFTDVTEGRFPAPEIAEFLAEDGHEFFNVTGSLSWSRSRLNRGFFPTRGSSQSLSFEATLPGSDLQFYRWRYEAQRFFPLNRIFTLRARTELGYGDAYGSTGSMPFYEHFFAGGFGSIRGYEVNTVGPRATRVSGDQRRSPPFGGNTLISGNLEVLFPMPFVEDKTQFRPVMFLDAGNVFNTECPDVSTVCSGPDLSELRYAMGLGMTWLTGLGPLTFSIAYPFNDGPLDETEFFQFELGRSF